MKRNKLYFEYVYCGGGWIVFTIRYNETKLKYCYSFVYGDPKDMIHWAEDIYNENLWEYSSDEEGDEWFFNYDGKYFTVADDKYDDEKNPYNDHVIRLKIKISKEELCKVLYKAIKRFQRSGLYNPCEWEAITFEEFLLSMFNSIDEAIDFMAKRSINQITWAFDKKYKGHFNYYEFKFFENEPYEYDLANYQKRKELIADCITSCNYLGWGGAPVMEIKSEILERLL